MIHPPRTPDYPQWLREAEEALTKAQYEMDTYFLFLAKVDETSLLFDTADNMMGFVKWAEEVAGWEHFNHVVDRCLRLDGPGEFQVRFEFLRKPGSDWRIECMSLDGAPAAVLHNERLEQKASPTVIHASFKLPDAVAYEACLTRLTGLFAPGRGRRAEYRNSYGRFAYFGRPGATWFLKPRVNLTGQ